MTFIVGFWRDFSSSIGQEKKRFRVAAMGTPSLDLDFGELREVEKRKREGKQKKERSLFAPLHFFLAASPSEIHIRTLLVNYSGGKILL